MTELAQPARRFRVIATGALGDAHKQAALDQATDRLMSGRAEAWAELPDVEGLRQRGHDARMRVIRDLDAQVARFRRNAEAAGATVYEAGTADEAAARVVEICTRAGAKLAAKSKSMLSEEIGLNEALDRAGIRAVETDLGEYILQLAGEHPVHIIVPAIEKTAADAAKLLGAVEGRELPAEVDPLLQAARRQLREVFLAADVGITGANFAVTDPGSICLVSNEGNARLVNSLPRVHIELIGSERLVESLDDLAVVLRLVPPAASRRVTANARSTDSGRRSARRGAER